MLPKMGKKDPPLGKEGPDVATPRRSSLVPVGDPRRTGRAGNRTSEPGAGSASRWHHIPAGRTSPATRRKDPLLETPVSAGMGNNIPATRRVDPFIREPVQTRGPRPAVSRGVGLEAAFTSETVGYRLLERAKLAPDQQRIVLVGSNQSFAYEALRESMLMQFPEGKAPPPLFGVSAQKGPAKGQSKGGPGQGKSGGKAKTVNVTEEAEAGADEGEPAEEDQDAGQEEEEPDVDDLAEQLQETLTVTSDKLKALTQARRYSNPAPSGQKSSKGKCKGQQGTSSQGKCHICHNPGHFARDCPKKGGKGKGTPNKTLYTEEEQETYEEEEQESFFVYMTQIEDEEVSIIPEVLINLATAKTSAGHMIVDTACQKLCHGASWFNEHENLLRELSLWSVREPTSQKFKFGAGAIQEATEKVLLPCVLKDEPVVLRSCELQVGIPLLGNLSLLTQLGAIIDLFQGKVYFKHLGVAVPIVRLANRHIAVRLLPDRLSGEEFPAEFHQWPKATDELALQPGRKLASKKGVSWGKPEVFNLEVGEPKTETRYEIEKEYDFSSFGSSAPEVQPRKSWDNAPSHASIGSMERSRSPTGQSGSGRTPHGNKSPPAELPRDGGPQMALRRQRSLSPLPPLVDSDIPLSWSQPTNAAT